jgi:RNA polymerase sigma-70 factor (ECF subfamily)
MTERAKKEIFLTLLEPVWQNLNGYARALTGNTEDAKDLVSDTLLAAFENFEKLKDKDAFKSYLFTIARRKYKRNNWRLRLFSSYDEYPEHEAFNFESRESDPDIRVDVGLLYKAMKELPEKQREAITLFEISGLSLQEIQVVQGGTLSGVKTRLKRAREKLAELLREGEKSVTVKKNGNALKNIGRNNKMTIDVKAQLNLK